MQITDVFPKDIHIVLELSASEIKQITNTMDHSEVEFNGKDEPEMIAAYDTFQNFYKLLKDFEDGLPQRTAA